MPPAVNCVNEIRGTLECAIVAEGRRMSAPAGNSTTSLRSQRTKWTPFVASNFPIDWTAHQPKGRLQTSRCLNVHTLVERRAGENRCGKGSLEVGKACSKLCIVVDVVRMQAGRP